MRGRRQWKLAVNERSGNAVLDLQDALSAVVSKGLKRAWF